MDPTALIEVYRQTKYVIEDGEISFTIRLVEQNPGLDRFLADSAHGSWAFLTAYNPLSQPLSENENSSRQIELKTYLNELRLTYLNGSGIGDDPSWEPEPSLFILDIGRHLAIETARHFDQNAILWGEAGSIPELIWCQ